MWATVLRTSAVLTLAHDPNHRGFSHSPLSLRCLCLFPGQGLQGSSPKGGWSPLPGPVHVSMAAQAAPRHPTPQPPPTHTHTPSFLHSPTPCAPVPRPFLDCRACQDQLSREPRAPAALLLSTQIRTRTPFSHRYPPFRLPFFLFSLGLPQFLPSPVVATRSQLKASWGASEKTRGLDGSVCNSPHRLTPGVHVAGGLRLLVLERARPQ